MKYLAKRREDTSRASSSSFAIQSKKSLTTNQLKPAYYLLGTLVAAASISGALLVSSRVSADDNTVIDDVSIEVPVSCSMAGNVTTAHTASLMNGIYSGGTTEYANGIGSTTLSVSCNDAGGFSIYTVGFTGDKEGDNTLKGTNTGLTIPTGVYSTGDTTSKWSMKITEGADSGDTENHPLTIDNGFDSFHTVPSESDGYQRIAHKDAATDMNATPGASVTTTYDAYIDTTQAADTYTGQVKYVMVHPYSSTDDNKPTIKPIMQSFTNEMCQAQATDAPITVRDERDNNEYTVRYINGNCWMTQNLRFTGSTLEPATSNVASTRTMTWYDLTSSYCNSTSESGTSMSNHCYHVSDNTEYGVYYNYAGVSAGTITGSSTSTEDTYNVCPANWTLPTLDQQQSITSYTSSFSPVYSGSYYGGSLSNVGSLGYWWSSTAYNSTLRYFLGYYSGSLDTSYRYRYSGLSARCVRK